MFHTKDLHFVIKNQSGVNAVKMRLVSLHVSLFLDLQIIARSLKIAYQRKP